MNYDNSYRDRLYKWKNDPEFLAIAGFSLIICEPLTNYYYKKIFENNNKEYNIKKDNSFFEEINTQHIHHYVKKFYFPNELTSPYVPKEMIKVFSKKNIEDYFAINNQVLVSYLQLNKDLTNNTIFFSWISSIKIPYLYPLEFYVYIHHKYLNNNFYQIYEDLFYEYFLYKRNIKHYYNKIKYIDENKIIGKKIYDYNFDLISYEMCIVNLLLFKGIKFPLGDDYTWIPKCAYDLFLCQYIIDNFKYKATISNMKTPLTEAIFNNYKNIYENNFLKNLPIYKLFYDYFNNTIDKNEYYSDVNRYYESDMYDNIIYDLLYNYFPEKKKSFKSFYYEKQINSAIASIEALDKNLNALTEEEKTKIYIDYFSYCLANDYLKRNYNIYMQYKYQKILPKETIDTYDNDKEIIIQIDNKVYVFNKPEKPKTDLVIYLEENFDIKNTFMKYEENIISEFDKYCKDFITNEDLLEKYKEKEAEQFELFKKKLFQWEKYGYYEITI